MTVSARDAYAVECDGIRQNFGVVAELTVIMAAKQVVVTKYITAAAPSLRSKPRLTLRLIYAPGSGEFVSQRLRWNVSSINVYLNQMHANSTYRVMNWMVILNVKLYIVKAASRSLLASILDATSITALIKRTDFNCCVITGWLSFTGIQCSHL